jgi:cysteinyl-tRNA synthetase
MGMTDIDDKIIEKAKGEGSVEWKDIEPMVRRLENNFFSDLDKLNIRRPNAVLRVSDHMDDVIGYITNLVALGHAYITNDGVYFSVSSAGDTYGKLGAVPPSAHLNETNIADGDYNGREAKRDWRDFALWKSAKPNEPTWSSPWGQGRATHSIIRIISVIYSTYIYIYIYVLCVYLNSWNPNIIYLW